MSQIRNTPDIVGDLAEVNRAQIEHRATWMGLIYDEMLQAGLDAEPMIRRAIKRCGLIHGDRIKERCSSSWDCTDFKDAFLGTERSVVAQTFQMKNIQADPEQVGVDFHYCPLLSAWQKLGFDDERCANLCDMAMDGDRGIAEAMGLTLELEETLANGDAACKLRFRR